MPLLPILRHAFQVAAMRQNRCCRFHAPARDPWITVCTVANHRQIIRNRFWSYPELFHHAGFIAHQIALAIELNDSCPDDALAEVFVRCTDENSLNSFVLR